MWKKQRKKLLIKPDFHKFKSMIDELIINASDNNETSEGPKSLSEEEDWIMNKKNN